MAEELAKIEKPAVESFIGGRRLYFIPLIYQGIEPPADYVAKFRKYWTQVENHLSNLELKLEQVNKVYHELVPQSGEDGVRAVKDLNDGSYQIIKNRADRGARFEALEDGDLLTEYMDWSRCLTIGLQNQGVIFRVYGFYTEANKKRNDYITKHLDETLGADETGLLFMREGHQIQFPADVQVFYVSPPALDEIHRWFRDRESQSEVPVGPEKEGQEQSQ